MKTNKLILILSLLFIGINTFGQTPKPIPVEMNDGLWARLINGGAKAGTASNGHFSAKFAQMFGLGDGTNSVRIHDGNFSAGKRIYHFTLVVEENIDAIVVSVDIDGRGTICLTDRSRKLRAAAIGDKDGIRLTTIDQSVESTFKDILKALAQIAVKLPPDDKLETKTSSGANVPKT